LRTSQFPTLRNQGDPPNHSASIVLRDPIDRRQMLGQGRSSPGTDQHRQDQRLAARMWTMVSKQKLAQEIIAVHAFALPEQGENSRRPHGLARLKLEMRACHAGADRHGFSCPAREVRRPFARPANGKDNSATAEIEIEKGEEFTGRTPAARLKVDLLFALHDLGHRRVIIDAAERAARIMQHRIHPVFRGRQIRVQRQNVLQNRRVG
jgi:hypothetical protein